MGCDGLVLGLYLGADDGGAQDARHNDDRSRGLPADVMGAVSNREGLSGDLGGTLVSGGCGSDNHGREGRGRDGGDHHTVVGRRGKHLCDWQSERSLGEVCESDRDGVVEDVGHRDEGIAGHYLGDCVLGWDSSGERRSKGFPSAKNREISPTNNPASSRGTGDLRREEIQKPVILDEQSRVFFSRLSLAPNTLRVLMSRR